MRFVGPVALFLCCATVRGEECLLNIALLDYEPIPLQARAQGSVAAHFTVDQTGRAKDDTYETKQPFLLPRTRLAVQETKFPATCAGEYSVIVEFRIRDEVSYDRNRVVEILEPSTYRVSINTPHANIDYAPPPTESRSRRLLRKVFRR